MFLDGGWEAGGSVLIIDMLFSACFASHSGSYV